MSRAAAGGLCPTSTWWSTRGTWQGCQRSRREADTGLCQTRGCLPGAPGKLSEKQTDLQISGWDCPVLTLLQSFSAASDRRPPVRPGESLASIAQTHHIDLRSLQAANRPAGVAHGHADVVHEGQRVQLPFRPHVIQTGDSLAHISSVTGRGRKPVALTDFEWVRVLEC